MDYVFLFYIFLSFVIGTAGAYILYSTGHGTAAMIYLVGVLIIEIYFGTQWFSGDGTANVPKGPWPPSINVCPDFLSLYSTGGKSYCVDTVGVAASGGITKWVSGATVSDKNAFPLSADLKGAARTKALCAQAKSMNVTWEGVWDGSTCLGGEPPIPPA